MTPKRRWPSFSPTWRKVGFGSIFLLALFFLLIFSLKAFPPHGLSRVPLSIVAHLFFPLIVYGWMEHGLIWGIGSAMLGAIGIGLSGLAVQEGTLLWLPLQFLLLGLILHVGIRFWEGTLHAEMARRERLEEEVNTLESENRILKETSAGAQARLERYQQLRRIADQFNATLAPEGLIPCITQATGQLVEKADRVLLYLVDLQSLWLELKNVWSRTGPVTVKAKTGDSFDQWVMRQAQPLLVEEPSRDFRFPSISSDQLGRPLGSLLVVPLFGEMRPLGVLRAESSHPGGLGGEDLRLVRIVADLASLGIENSRLYNRTAELAMTDDLTGLSVRSHAEKWLEEEILRAGAQGRPVSLLLIDIDRFKVYNDTFGHSAGDKLLKQLAVLLRRAHRPGEMAARWGGEEFTLLLPGVDPQEAFRRAEEIRKEVEATRVELRRSVTTTTVSIGVATFPQDGSTVEGLLRVADERLYRAKGLGRNRVCAVGVESGV